MDLLSEQPATSDLATNNISQDSETSIKCQHCKRRFARISVEGGLIPFVPQEQACASCELFLGLYETLQTREREHTALLDRGQKHHGRAVAHEKYRNARVALENLLISIEAPNEATFDVVQAGFANRADPLQLEHIEDRVRTPEYFDGQPSNNGEQSRMEPQSPTKISLITKRKVLRNRDTSKLERKRIKFTETVEERPEYRSTVEFYRGGKEYVPGRYVVAEGSEYLDTSGSTLTFAKFTGQKKVGSSFIDIVPNEEVHDDGSGTSAEKKAGRANVKKKQADQEVISSGEKQLPERETNGRQVNGRQLRDVRQSRSTLPTVTTRPRRNIARYGGQDAPGESRENQSFVVV